MVNRRRLNDVLGEGGSTPSSENNSFAIVGEDGKPLPVKKLELEGYGGDLFTITIPRPSYLPEKRYAQR